MNDNQLSKHIIEQLDAGNDQLDGAVRLQLMQARHRALASRPHPVWVVPALGGVVFATIVAVMVWMHTPDNSERNEVSDFEMLTQGDSIELYQDLEFLEWLDEEGSHGTV